jgi:hypothetical protein
MGNAIKKGGFQGMSQHASRSSQTDDPYLYIVAVLGVAAGFSLALAVWLVNSIMTTDDISSITPESTVAINASEIRKTNNNIRHLHERVELLSGPVANLEAMLKRITLLTDGVTDNGKNTASSAKQDNPESENVKPAYNRGDPDASRLITMNPETQKTFIPTHTVNDWLNLRPSSSLNTKPIAVLKAGSDVEYIARKDNWYYVNTQMHGKGWCYSDYLTPLLPARENNSNLTLDLQSKLP